MCEEYSKIFDNHSAIFRIFSSLLLTWTNIIVFC